MYEKTTWANGDIITAEKLNHIEDGIANNVLVVRLTVPENDQQHCYSDVSWSEIQDAFYSNIPVFGILAYEEDGEVWNVRLLNFQGYGFAGIYAGGSGLSVVDAILGDEENNEYDLFTYLVSTID